MRTLYLRNVPDDVVERLERLAARDATSVSAVAIRELAEVSRCWQRCPIWASTQRRSAAAWTQAAPRGDRR